MKKRHILSLLIAAIIPALVLTACHQESYDPASSYIMFVNSSPDLLHADIFSDSSKLNTAGEFIFTYNTPYNDVGLGTHYVAFRKYRTNTVINSLFSDFRRDKHYTIFCADSAARMTPVLVQDSLFYPPSNMCYVRFAHMAPTLSALDVRNDTMLMIYPNVPFKGVTDFKPMPKGTYVFKYYAAGDTTTNLYRSGPITFSGGRMYTIYTHGTVGGTGTNSLRPSIIENKSPLN
jgi:Domain of unknown function (DUF4397)